MTSRFKPVMKVLDRLSKEELVLYSAMNMTVLGVLCAGLGIEKTALPETDDSDLTQSQIDQIGELSRKVRKEINHELSISN